MITPELLDFIEAELKAGQTKEGLFHVLREGGGWTEEDIREAIEALEKRKRPVSIAEMLAQNARPAASHTSASPVIAVAPTALPASAPITPAPAAPIGQVISHTPATTPTRVEPLDTKPIVTPVVPAHAPVVEVTHVQSSVPPHIATPSHDAPEALQPLPPSQTPLTAQPPLERPADARKLTRTAPPPLNIPHEVTTQIVSPERPNTPVPSAGKPVFDMGASAHTEVHTGEIVQPAKAPSGMSLRARGSKGEKLIIAIAGVVLLGLFGVGAYVLSTRVSPKADKIFATMYASIPGIQSLRYNGETTLNFSGTVTDPLKAQFPNGYKGSAKVALKYDGRADLTKGIDGVHQFGITADLRSGESAIAINSSVELRIIGDTYYIKITNPPTIKDIDLSRLNSFWIAVSPSDIVDRFGGTLTGEKDAYGAFGGASTTPTLRGFLSANPPIESAEKVGEEKVGGADTIHYRFKGNPDNLIALLRFIVLSVTGAPWEMNQEEEANVKALLSGLAGDIWIDSVSYLPRKIIFREPLAGTVSGIALDGTLDVEQSYSEYNGQISVPVPRPVMTYDEFADDVKRQSERAKATGDARRIFDADDIISALEVYRANNNDTYPLTLDALVTSGLIPAIPMDPNGSPYLYVPFTEKGKVAKKNVCVTSSPTCTFFHLGVTLDDQKNTVLETDSDLTSETISGVDTKGCGKEADKACYDLVPASR